MSKITDSARGEDCTIRIPDVCNFDPETTVAAHISNGVMGKKAPDTQIAYACSKCHAAVDGHLKTIYKKHELYIFHLEGMVRTQLILLEKGLIKEA